MPCTVDMKYEDRVSLAKAIRENNKLTSMLCALMTRASEMDINAVPGLAAWWDAHQESDAKRKERLRATGISKLTEAEIDALGIIKP